MKNEKMFEMAIRNKMRFPYKGLISVEDMWDLSVRDLDSVFKTLNSQVKKANEESLLNTKTKEDETLDIMIEIVKYIVSVKFEENEKRQKAKENREQRQKIMKILASKRDTSLENMSEEELEAKLQELEA